MTRTRRTALVALLVMAGGLVGLSRGEAGAAPPAEPVDAVAADDRAAQAAARRLGRPVEVLARRTERERRYANPDGSWTSELDSSPVRVRRVDGSWMPVDTTLRRAADVVVPVAVPVDVRFSAGGSGPAARVAIGARDVAVSLPWPLPVPVLDGARATYPEVLPGVDVVLTAHAEGFSEVLVVRDRVAAGQPALRELRFRLSATGLSLRAEGGGLVAVDAAGRAVFASPAPRMWDSAGGDGAAASSAAGAGPRAVDWPAAGDRHATMVASLAGDELSVVPDRAMLEDPATVFPVYIDPSVSASRGAWAMIQSGFGGDDEFYKFTGDEGMGLCDVQVESSCVQDNVKRLVWMFSVPAAVRGSHVLSATFKAYETHAYDCTADRVDLYRTGAVGPGTNWDNHTPTWTRYLTSVTVARKSGCSLGPGWVEFNATGGAQEAASAGWQALALGLKAYSETSMPGGWKRFRYDAQLSITYNRYPNVPSYLSAEGAGCGSGSTRPLLSTATPTLRAIVSDPDPETDLRAAFAWERWTGSAWVGHGSGSQSSLASYSTAQFRIGSGLVHNEIYRWRVQAQDPWAFEGASGTDSSAWSGFCEFQLDLVGPGVPPGVSSPVYGTDLNQVYGAVGLTADFTFTASGVTDVAGYRWGWADPPTTYVAAPTLGGAVTLPLTPPPPKPADPTSGGQMALYVVSVDRTGRASPMVPYVFTIGSATDPVGVWQMTEPAGSTTLADTTTRGTPHPATLTAATAGAAGRILSGPARSGPTVVTFNGSASYAATSGPVLNTSNSFTVSAWARPTVAKWSALVAQSGVSQNGPFGIQYTPSETWTFATYSSDGSPVISSATSAATAVGKWTHLVGVYDAGVKQIRLYVNGSLAGTATVGSLWNGTGPLQIGRIHWLGTYYNYFAGDIAEVKVWDRVVSAAELAPMAATLVGRWGLDGDGTDSAPYGRDATSGVVDWGDDHNGMPLSAASLDGVNHWLATAGPALRTDQSFSVSAWARPTQTPSTSAWGPVVCQSGVVQNAPFDVQYTDNGTWTFDHYSADGTGRVTTRARSTTPTPLDTWAHLAAVYDASAKQIRLYVNGALAAAATVSSLWHGAGPLQIGRVHWNGGYANHFAGDIDDVRAYAGVLPASEITKLAG